MKILVVASYNHGRFSPFVSEQAEALRQAGCAIEFFGIRGKGIGGYWRERKQLQEKIRITQPDVIHAHYGLSGLLANISTRRIPIVTTYHGSDVNEASVRVLSKIAIRLSAWNIFVSQKLMEKAQAASRSSVIPCGVTLPDTAWSGSEARKVLFSGAFNNEVKDASLAIKAMEGVDAKLVELKGYTRDEVNRMLCSVRCLLMTSKSEGSPQIIKEAMACGCPIVSVDVGDVRQRIEGVKNCYIVPRDYLAIREAINKVKAERTGGREKIIADGLTNEQVAKKIMDVYARVMR